MIDCDGKKLETADKFDKIFLGHTPTLNWNVGEDIIINKKVFMTVRNPIYTPIIKAGIHLIDTGCGKGGHLTIYDVYENTYHQSIKKY